MLLNEILALSSMKVHGLPINVEVERGKQRIIKNDQGEVVYKKHMHHAYGEIKNTKGRDGDPVDVFVGPMGDRAKEVYIVHMKDLGPDVKEREDEDKCFVGFASADLAKQAFLLHYPPSFYGGMTSLPVAEFKKRLKQTQSPHTHNMLHAGGPGSGRHPGSQMPKIEVQQRPEWGTKRRRLVFQSPHGEGHLSMLDYGDHYRVTSTGVPEALQGKGYGKHLYNHAIELARKEGKSEIRSDTSVTDKAAHVWQSLGATKQKTDFGNQFVLKIPPAIKANSTITAKEAKRKFYEACMKAGLSPERFILRAAQTYGRKFSFRELLNAAADMVTKEYKVSASPDVLVRLERFLAHVEWCSKVGHSTTVGMEIDGDGPDRFEVSPSVLHLHKESKVITKGSYPGTNEQLTAANPRSSIENCPHCKSFSFRIEGNKASRRCRACGTVWSAKKPSYRLKAGGPGSGRHSSVRIIDGIKYLMRDTRPTSELRALHQAFEQKYGKMDFHKWLAERGKVHIKIKGSGVPKVQLEGKSQATPVLGAIKSAPTAPVRPPVLAKGCYKL